MSSNSTSTEQVLRRPLAAGEQVTYWHLGATAEARYDVADQPMQGEMDPFFFLTKHKNFIPHEYPCRTQFISEFRDKRPTPTTTYSPARVWMPFGAPRVDLSGFWFRPTRLETWAVTTIDAKSAGKAQFRLSTCGGAILFVNGKEVGWMAPYGRNLETGKLFDVDLIAGANEFRVYFDDLAERDARYFFKLDLISGPTLEQALPVPVAGSIAANIEAMLDDMRFEHPYYDNGQVALITAAPLPVAADVTVAVEGDFMSIEAPRVFKLSLAAGANRLPIAETNDLPADFRHFKVSVHVGGLTVVRTFGVEISHQTKQGAAPATLEARIREALDAVSEEAEADSVRALARLATGRIGVETDAMLEGVLPAIEDCHDCADFILVPLLWCRIAYAGSIAPAVVARMDKAILSYRYWMDERGNDVQWYFSENHALLFHTACYLAGHLLPAETFVRSGRIGSDQSATGAARVRGWLDHFEDWEMAEFNSAPYFPIDLKGLTALYALAPDADIRDRAGQAIVRLAEVVARSAHHGQITGAQGRSYEHTLRAGRSLELAGVARMLWGVGSYGDRFHTLPQLALCLRDHHLVIPASLTDVARWTAEGAQEWVFAQGQNRIAKLYHYKSRSTAMGSAAHYRWNEWGYQETVLHLRIGTNPDAQVWINHPGETLHSGYGRPSYWGGSGTLPRVHQYRGLSVLIFKCAAEQPDFTHAWFPQSVFDAVSVEGNVALAQSGDGIVLLQTSGPLDLVSHGPTAGNELRLAGHQGTWIVRTVEGGDIGAAKAAFSKLALHGDPAGVLTIEDPVYGMITMHPDGRIEAEGRVVDPANWTVPGTATTFATA